MNSRVPVERVAEITDALHREAQMLDDGRYEEWLALLSSDVRYVADVEADTLGEMVRSPGAPTLRLFDDGFLQLQVRIAKIRTGLSQSENPPSRTVRVIGTVTVDVTDEPDVFRVRSAFLLYRHRRQRQVEVLAGHRIDRWRLDGQTWKLDHREIRFAANVLPTKSLSLLY